MADNIVVSVKFDATSAQTRARDFLSTMKKLDGEVVRTSSSMVIYKEKAKQVEVQLVNLTKVSAAYNNQLNSSRRTQRTVSSVHDTYTTSIKRGSQALKQSEAVAKAYKASVKGISDQQKQAFSVAATYNSQIQRTRQLQKQTAKFAKDNFSLTARLNAQTQILIGRLRTVAKLYNSITTRLRSATNAPGSQFAGKFLGLGSAFTGQETALAVVTGSSKAAEARMRTAVEISRDLKLDIEAVTREYVRFIAAFELGHVPVDKATKQFKNFAVGARVLNLTIPQTSRFFQALEQIMSRGAVSMEEVRKQLGNVLPGAFEMAAASMGFNTDKIGRRLQDFVELVSSGTLSSKEFLEKFSEFFENRFASRLPQALDTASAATTAFVTEWKLLQISVERKLDPAIAGVVSVGVKALSVLNDAITTSRAGFSGASRSAVDTSEKLGQLTVSAKQTNNALASLEVGAVGLTGSFAGLASGAILLGLKKVFNWIKSRSILVKGGLYGVIAGIVALGAYKTFGSAFSSTFLAGMRLSIDDTQAKLSKLLNTIRIANSARVDNKDYSANPSVQRLELQVAGYNRLIADERANIFQLESQVTFFNYLYRPKATERVQQQIVTSTERLQKYKRKLEELVGSAKLLSSQLLNMPVTSLSELSNKLSEPATRIRRLQNELKILSEESIRKKVELKVNFELDEQILRLSNSTERDAPQKLRQLLKAREQILDLELQLATLRESKKHSKKPLTKPNSPVEPSDAAIVEFRKQVDQVFAAEQNLIKATSLALGAQKKYGLSIQVTEGYLKPYKKAVLDAKSAQTFQNAEIIETTQQMSELQQMYASAQSGVNEYALQASDLMSQIRSATINAFQSMEDSLVNFVTTGKVNFKSLVNSILSDIARIAIRKQLTAPLASLVSSALGSTFDGASDFITTEPSLVTSTALSGPVQSLDVVVANAKGNIFDDNIIPFAKGDVINRPVGFSFGGGKRGVAGEAGPEAIMPVKRMPSGDLGVQSIKGKTVLNVNVYASGDAQQTKIDFSERNEGDVLDIFINKVEDRIISRTVQDEGLGAVLPQKIVQWSS